MKKKTGKIILSLLSLFLVAVIAFFANAFFGNPVSKALAKNAAEKYLIEAYSDCDFEIDNVYFNFKSKLTGFEPCQLELPPWIPRRQRKN